MERPMSIVLSDETSHVMNNDPHQLAPENTAVPEASAAPERRNQPSVPSPQQRDAAESPSADHPMRLPFFDESCPHVRDQIIPMNGGHFNVDHYLRVLRAKSETDVSIAMALTAVGQQRTPTARPE